MDKAIFIKHKDIIIKWAEGEIIQCKQNGEWIDVQYRYSLNFNDCTEYRIKPSPEYVPFDFSDAEKLIGKAIVNPTKSVYLTISVMIEGCRNILLSSNIKISYDDLLRGYSFLDESPCGKLKE